MENVGRTPEQGKAETERPSLTAQNVAHLPPAIFDEQNRPEFDQQPDVDDPIWELIDLCSVENLSGLELLTNESKTAAFIASVNRRPPLKRKRFRLECKHVAIQHKGFGDEMNDASSNTKLNASAIGGALLVGALLLLASNPISWPVSIMLGSGAASLFVGFRIAASLDRRKNERYKCANICDLIAEEIHG